MQTYQVICKKCKGSSIVTIENFETRKLINWRELGSVISGRLRLDDNWGWQCYCGNNSLMTKQELKSIENYAQPKPQEISQIIKNLIPESETQFIMEVM